MFKKLFVLFFLSALIINISKCESEDDFSVASESNTKQDFEETDLKEVFDEADDIDSEHELIQDETQEDSDSDSEFESAAIEFDDVIEETEQEKAAENDEEVEKDEAAQKGDEVAENYEAHGVEEDEVLEKDSKSSYPKKFSKETNIKKPSVVGDVEAEEESKPVETGEDDEHVALLEEVPEEDEVDEISEADGSAHEEPTAFESLIDWIIAMFHTDAAEKQMNEDEESENSIEDNQV